MLIKNGAVRHKAPAIKVLKDFCLMNNFISPYRGMNKIKIKSNLNAADSPASKIERYKKSSFDFSLYKIYVKADKRQAEKA